MGRELGEGKVHGLERQLALAKSFAEDMRRAHAELEDHCTTLDEEAEKLQDEVGSGLSVEAAVGTMRSVVVHASAVLDEEGNCSGLCCLGASDDGPLCQMLHKGALCAGQGG